jgi:hypothetical protein
VCCHCASTRWTSSLTHTATGRPQYAVARDGRFLINQPVGDAPAAPITLRMNWHPEAKKKK